MFNRLRRCASTVALMAVVYGATAHAADEVKKPAKAAAPKKEALRKFELMD